MSWGKDFGAVDMLFQFVVLFVDGASGIWPVCSNDKSTYNKHRAYKTKLKKDWNEENISSDMLSDVNGDIQKLKEMKKNTFIEHFETGLYTLKFLQFYHIVEGFEMFEGLDVLISAPFERNNVHIKNAYRSTS